MLGNGRCEATSIDGTKRLCHIRGKMHKKVWIASGDIILVGLRDYQNEKADVILKYMPDEARLLKAYGEHSQRTPVLIRALLVVLMRRMKVPAMITSSLKTKISIRSRHCRIVFFWVSL
ncbi:hypothetical protein EZV62_008083 [Acer yangbiense]|uniref:S1-like domain-containing protein n=1 Tax=Acer yangbiense TaxID=1000413 RepID=A0A5C7ICJ6_9ROSI|nr:hypothetical protein EZV62_008083 [Acer yangbiense]